MNKKITIFYIFLTTIIISGCYNNTKKATEKYINTDLKPAIEVQKEVLDKYNNLLQTKDLSPKMMIDSLEQSIIPQYKSFITMLENISPESQEINEVHIILVEGSKKQLQVFITLRDGLSENSTKTIYQAEELLKESKEYMINFNKYLEELI